MSNTKNECLINCIGKKNLEMWENYRTIDPRVIRPLDGNEFFVANCYINIIDVFPKISTEEFKKRAEENLAKLEIFNIALKRMNGHLFFIHKPFKMHLEEVEYNEDEEIENYLKKEEEIIIPYEPIQEEDDKDVQSLYSFKICQLKKSNQTKITISACHAISDGRCTFTMMTYIRRIINGETIEKNEEMLPNFGGMERFKDVDEKLKSPPEVWKEIPDLSILPKIEPPYKYVMSHKIFDYHPISKFISENGITIQAMLMAMLTRATRRYKNLPKETPLWNAIPVDPRFSSHATEEYKKRQFYLNVSGIYVKSIGQSSLMEGLKHCMLQLQENRKKNDDVNLIISCSSNIDPKTLKFVPKGMFPDIHSKAVVSNSNIGRVKGTFPLLTVSNDPMIFYNFFTHSYHTDDKLFVTIYRPINFDESYINYINEEMNKIFIPGNISNY